jgi:hypothetical protein
MATRTLAQLRSRVAKRAAVTVATGARHTATDVDAYINDSIESYHLALTECGHPQRVKRATASTSASSADSNGFPAYSYVALPSDFLALLGVWRMNDDARACPLDAFAESDYGLVGETGEPKRFRLAENSAGLKILRLLPNADAVYTIAFVYLPAPSVLAVDGDTIAVYPGGTEFIVCDSALKLLEDDGVQESAAFQAITARREAARQELYTFAKRQNQAGSLILETPPLLSSYATLPDYLR